MSHIGRAGVVLLILVLVGELIARFGFGLGTPPLSVAHPSIEYMFTPNQDVMRFGNRQLYNEVGMRSGPVPQDGTPIVLVMGDSVVNGGALTDHEDLATERLSQELAAEGRPTFVGNVSAGSWGPANQLAYLREFGDFGAEAVVLVLSSHDAGDVPNFEPLSPLTHPTRRPALALWEGVMRYLPRYVPALAPPPSPPAVMDEPVAALDEVDALVQEVRTRGIELCVVHHWTQAELDKGLSEQGRLLNDALEAQGVSMVSDGPMLTASTEAGRAPLRDDVHLSDEGHVVLADALRECLVRIGTL